MWHPRELGRRDVERFLSNLATEGRVSASTQKKELTAHLERVREVFRLDLIRGGDGVSLPHAFNRKAPSAAWDWSWHWVFPATRQYIDVTTGDEDAIISMSLCCSEQ